MARKYFAVVECDGCGKESPPTIVTREDAIDEVPPRPEGWIAVGRRNAPFVAKYLFCSAACVEDGKGRAIDEAIKLARDNVHERFRVIARGLTFRIAEQTSHSFPRSASSLVDAPRAQHPDRLDAHR